jgi:hypothetical protein
MATRTPGRRRAFNIGSLLIMILLACGEGEKEVDSVGTHSAPNPGLVFLSQLIHVPPGEDSTFSSFLGACRAPVWKRLLREGSVQDVRVYELDKAEETLPEATTWDFLILVEMASGSGPQQILGGGLADGACLAFPHPTHTVLRTETLSPTPASYFPEPHPMHRGRAAEVEYLVEFTGVEDTPEARATYRSMMETYWGPENGVLVAEGKLFSLVALETTEVLYQEAGVSPWSQLHISGDLPEYMDLDWDSVYVDLTQRLFSADLDSLWAQMPKVADRPGNYVGRLVKELWVH